MSGAAALVLLALFAQRPGVWAAEPPTVVLWPGGAPGAAGTQDEGRSALTVYLLEGEKAKGTGVVVCPGGGYRGLAMDHAGRQIAGWLNGYGVAACVLKYRLGPRYLLLLKHLQLRASYGWSWSNLAARLRQQLSVCGNL